MLFAFFWYCVVNCTKLLALRSDGDAQLDEDGVEDVRWHMRSCRWGPSSGRLRAGKARRGVGVASKNKGRLDARGTSYPFNE